MKRENPKAIFKYLILLSFSFTRHNMMSVKQFLAPSAEASDPFRAIHIIPTESLSFDMTNNRLCGHLHDFSLDHLISKLFCLPEQFFPYILYKL